MIGHLKDIVRGMGGEWIVSFTTTENPVSLFYRLRDHELEIDIRKVEGKHRSKDANAFCWSLCTLIGNSLRPPLPKEEVYRRAIREVGEYEPLPIRADAVDTFQRRWSQKGSGWFAEVIDDSKIPGYKLVFAYYGSSTYDTGTMSRLIDYLLDEAKQMQLPIPASKEHEEIIKAWKEKSR